MNTWKKEGQNAADLKKCIKNECSSSEVKICDGTEYINEVLHQNLERK